MRESPQAIEAYALYRDMGMGRSTDRVGKQLGKSHDLIQRWCTAHGWVVRVKAYDAEIEAEAEAKSRAARLADIERRRENRLKGHDIVRRRAVEAIGQMKPAQLAKAPAAVVSMLKYADDGERLDMGEATERQEISLKDMPDDALLARGRALGLTGEDRPS